MLQGYELNLRDYWSIFLKRKWIIVLSFSAVSVATIIYTNLQPVIYKATAIIKIEPTVGGLSDVFRESVYYTQPPQLTDYTRQIKSAPIMRKTVEESGLLPKNASSLEVDSLVATIEANLTAEIIQDTNMIRIVMVSESPHKAAIIANKIVEVFKIENIKEKNKQVRGAREFIEKQLERVASELKQAEDQLNNLILKGVGGSATNIIDKIAQYESARADLLNKFTTSHPNVQILDEQIAEWKNQLKNLPKEEFQFGDLRRDVSINENLYNLLRERLQEVQIRESERIDNIVLINPAIPPRWPFSPNKPGNYLIGMVLGILLGISSGLLFEHLDTSIGRIEDLESVTNINVIGVIPFFTERSKYLKEEAKRRKFFPFIRKVANMAEINKLQNLLIINQKESSVFMEAFRILGANLQVLFTEISDKKGKIIGITSSNPQEGKSIIAANLSLVMAQMGHKTVLVDLDLRRSSVHKIFGLKREKGLTDVLSSEVVLEAIVRTAADSILKDMDRSRLINNPWIDKFHLITAGSTFPNAPYLLNTEKMNQALMVLREVFDIIIMDCPPVLAVSDTSIIAPKTDGIIFVYRAGATSRVALRRAKMQMESTRGEGSVKGIILNNVTPEVNVDTYYYYYKGKYYREKEEELK